MRRYGRAFVSGHAAEIEHRARAGKVRDCHGDLRCEHVLIGDPVRIVDRIEFDPALREIDVGWDLAFLLMDLHARGRPDAARSMLAEYRRAGGDPGGEQLVSFYCAHWALVRAKVGVLAELGRQRRLRAGTGDAARSREPLLLERTRAAGGPRRRAGGERQVDARGRAREAVGVAGPVLGRDAQAPGRPGRDAAGRAGALHARVQPPHLPRARLPRGGAPGRRPAESSSTRAARGAPSARSCSGAWTRAERPDASSRARSASRRRSRGPPRGRAGRAACPTRRPRPSPRSSATTTRSTPEGEIALVDCESPLERQVDVRHRGARPRARRA